jgi:hypothetical protein
MMGRTNWYRSISTLLTAVSLLMFSCAAYANGTASVPSEEPCAQLNLNDCAKAIRTHLIKERPKILDALQALRSSTVAQLAATSILLGWLFALVSPGGNNNKILRILNLYKLVREKNPIPKYTKNNVTADIEEGAAWLIFLVILSTFYQVVQAPLTMGGAQPVNLLGGVWHVAFWANLAFQSIITFLIVSTYFSVQEELVSRANRTVSKRLKEQQPELSWFQRRRVISAEAQIRRDWFQEKLTKIGLTRRELLFVPLAQFTVNYGPVAGIEALKLL